MTRPMDTPPCSQATVAGNYGYTANGSLIGIGPVAATGISRFDGHGNVSGSQTRSVNGDIAEETFQGTYRVTPVCTGTEVIQVYESGQLVCTSTLQGVIEDNGRCASATSRRSNFLMARFFHRLLRLTPSACSRGMKTNQ